MYTGVTTWWSDLQERAADEGGATAVEYALMVALIAVVIIGAVTVLGNNASDKFTQVGDAVGNA
ncbi:MAG: Flp family type IVb pilin [Actinomycetota bacterium]